MFKIDFKRDPRDGRFLAARNGVNLAQVAYEYLVNGARPQRNVYGTRFRWLYFRLDYRAYRELAAGSKLTLWQRAARCLARVFSMGRLPRPG